jgi:voltage-gated sodium channel
MEIPRGWNCSIYETAGTAADLGRTMSSKTEFINAYGDLEIIPAWRPKALTKLVYSRGFELLIAFVILSNAVSLAILTVPTISDDTRSAALALDEIAFWIYVVELGLRLVSYGKKPWMFFSRGWNVFDFLVIGLAPFLQGQTAVLRLLRLLRLVRIFRFLPEVRVLSQSILKSIPPLMSMSVLIGLMLFLYGMAGYYLFGQGAPESWGNIGSSMKSLFILLTLENFPVYLDEALAINAIALPFFLSYVFIVVFTVLNVLIGIVLNAMDEARAEEKSTSKSTKAALFKLAKDLDEITSDGEVSKRETTMLKKEIARLINLQDSSPAKSDETKAKPKQKAPTRAKKK